MSLVNVTPRERPSVDWGGGYLALGRLLGALASFLTFVAGWIFCLLQYGFLLGGGLGWFPSGIAAAIVGFLVAALWGPLLLIALVWGISSLSHKNQPTPAAWAPTPTDFNATSTAPEATPAPAIELPPPPNVGTVDRAVTDFQRVLGSGGMGTAVTTVMDCYNKLQTAPTWDGWDYCAAFDQMGGMTSAAAQYPTEYFAWQSISGRQERAANAIRPDYNATNDRIAALKAVLEQAFENRTKAAEAAAYAAANQPSFDCSKVTSANLKLVCSTPSLAQADREMAEAYKAAAAATTSLDTLKESQREWVKRRNNAPTDAGQLASMYAERTSQLTALVATTPASSSTPLSQ